MFFLLLEGETQIARMPQRAGTASFSHKIIPSWIPSSGFLTESLLVNSLWRLKPPNWRGDEFFFSFACMLLFSSAELEINLYAFVIGSATTHPDTLWDEMNR